MQGYLDVVFADWRFPLVLCEDVQQVGQVVRLRNLAASDAISELLKQVLISELHLLQVIEQSDFLVRSKVSIKVAPSVV